MSAGVNDPNGEAEKELNPVTEVCGVNDPRVDDELDGRDVTDASAEGDT